MASSGCPVCSRDLPRRFTQGKPVNGNPVRRATFLLGLIAACVACANCTTQPATAAPRIDAGVELPVGPGREILIASCLSCHQLGGLALFKGFYTRDSWRTLVLTMIEHGAEINATEVELLADYLEQHFGPDIPQ